MSVSRTARYLARLNLSRLRLVRRARDNSGLDFVPLSRYLQNPTPLSLSKPTQGLNSTRLHFSPGTPIKIEIKFRLGARILPFRYINQHPGQVGTCPVSFPFPNCEITPYGDQQWPDACASTSGANGLNLDSRHCDLANSTESAYPKDDAVTISHLTPTPSSSHTFPSHRIPPSHKRSRSLT